MFTSRLLMVWRWALLILILGLLAEENGSAQSTPTPIRKIGLGTLRAIALSPDSSKILSCSQDGYARLWDSTTEQVLWSKPYLINGSAVAGFSNDGKKMIAGSVILDVLEVATGKSLGKLTGHTSNVNAISFSADGKTVVTGSLYDLTARTWDLGTCTALKTLRDPNFSNRRIFSVACSPDGSRVLGGSNMDGLSLWDALTGKVLSRPQVWPSGGVQSFMYSPQGTCIAFASTAAPNKIQLWNTSMTQVLATYSGHSGSVNAVAFSADGTRLVSGSTDGTTRLWDVGTSQTIRVFSVPSGGIGTALISADNKKILTSGDDYIARLWNADTGDILHSYTEFLPSQGPVSFSPDGTAILVQSGTSQWCQRDVATGQVIKTYPKNSMRGSNALLSPDGSKILTIYYKEADIWDAKTGQLLHALKGHTNNVTCGVFSADSAKVLTGSYDYTARLWDVATSQTLRTYPGNYSGSGITAVAFSPDGGRIALGGDEGGVKVRNAATGVELLSIPNPNPSLFYQDTVKVLAFAPDGARIIAGYRDGTRIWDASKVQKLNELLNYEQVNSATFSPDGSKALIAVHRNSAKLWDLATGSILQTYSGQNDEVYATFAPDGSKVLTSSSDGTVWLWSTMPTQAREWSRYE